MFLGLKRHAFLDAFGQLIASCHRRLSCCQILDTTARRLATRVPRRGQRTAGGDTPLEGLSVESFYLPCVAPGGVPPDVRRFFDKAPAVGAGHVDHHRDPVHDAPACHFPREIAAALHGAARQPREGTLGVIGVDGRERSAVAGVEGLQQVGGFAAAHFADDDVIGAVPQGMADQVADRDRAVLQPARLEADAVRGVVQLRMAWCPPLEGLESSSAIPTRTPQTSATDVR